MGGGVCVVSPTRGVDPSALAAHAGDVRFLLAPNHYHHLGVASWLASCARAVAVCSEAARPRLVRKVDTPWGELEDLAAALPEDASILVPEGTRNGEVWLEAAGTWIWPSAWLPSCVRGFEARRAELDVGAAVAHHLLGPRAVLRRVGVDHERRTAPSRAWR
jgi:hypothetical protein